MSIETVKAAYDVQLASPTPILKADMIPIHKDAVDLLADYSTITYTDSRIVKLTQAEYDALTPDESVLYLIVG